MSLDDTTRASTSSESTRAAFWTIAAVGVVPAAVAWGWYGSAQFEAQSEQPKALSADTTMAGFAEVFGGIPLLLAHAVGLVVLLVLGWFAYRGRGLALAVAAVILASLVGIAVAQLLWEGELFKLGIHNDTYVP